MRPCTTGLPSVFRQQYFNACTKSEEQVATALESLRHDGAHGIAELGEFSKDISHRASVAEGRCAFLLRAQ